MGTPLLQVNITDRALKEIKSIMENKGIPGDYGLRVGINGSGCAGVSYMVGFDKIGESDISYDKKGITVIISKKHVMYLVGVELDFYEGDDARGFTFNSTSEQESGPI